MRFMTWTVATLAFLVWSMIAWALFHFSDGLAAFAGGIVGGVFSSDIDPWVKWLAASLGNIVQGLVVVVWAIVAIAIFAVPAWMRRKRRIAPLAGKAGFPGGPTFGRDGQSWDRPSKDGLRPDWTRTRQDAKTDFDALKHIATDFIHRHGKGRKKKSWKRWDD